MTPTRSRAICIIFGHCPDPAELMGEINATLDKKRALAADAKERAAELKEVEAQQQVRVAELNKQREERKRLHAQISDKVAAQRKEIGNLQQNEKRLTSLIDRLSKILAAQAAKAAEAARAAEAAKIAEAARQKTKPRTEPESKTPPRREETPKRHARNLPKPKTTTNRLPATAISPARKGSLRLPVRGTVSGRFGSPRDGGWHLARTFHSCRRRQRSQGRGQRPRGLCRLDARFWQYPDRRHGDAYLSIYGNNESLLKQVGQSIKGGETIATAGNSGGNPESGLYFELRHQGQPLDPLKWASLK